MASPAHFSSKLPDAGTTIFTIISQVAQENGAINLGQGFPDFPMDSRLTNLVAEAMANGQNQYTHMFGLPALRQAIAQKIDDSYQFPADADEHITITPGGTYALFTAISTLLNKGDEALFFEPAYDSYLPQILVAGAKPIAIPLSAPLFSINWDRVKAVISSKTKVLIINSPHNPTGQVLSDEDIKALEELVSLHPQLTIVSDEVYEHLVFNGEKHRSVLASPLLKERSIACFSFGKTYHCTGWKLGYAVAPKWLTKEFRKIHQFNAFSCFTPTQVGLSQFIRQKDSYETLGAIMEKKQHFLQDALVKTPLKPLPTFGSYFQLYDYSAVSQMPELDFCHHLIDEAGVAAIPVSSFYSQPLNQGLIRLCFAKKEATLTAAADRLGAYFSRYSGD